MKEAFEGGLQRCPPLPERRMMEYTKGEISVTWCKKHSNWWVINCPDCMVDDNEESIKRVGMKKVAKWIIENSTMYYSSSPKELLFVEKDGWQQKLRDWGIE